MTPAPCSTSAPVVQASAETLPFAEDSFDAAMAVITVHHWSDLATGIAEMRRVARQRVVILTFTPTPPGEFWLGDYFPRALEIHGELMPPIDDLRALLPGAEVESVPVPRLCQDGFFFALWDRPEMHLDPEVRRASSVWHPMSTEQVEGGLASLSADLDSGRWDERHGHLRATPELDVGLRLVHAGTGSMHR